VNGDGNIVKGDGNIIYGDNTDAQTNVPPYVPS